MKYFYIKILIIIITLIFGMSEVLGDENTDLGKQESSFYERHKMAIINTIAGCLALILMYQYFKTNGSQNDEFSNIKYNPGQPCIYLSSFQRTFDADIFPVSYRQLMEVAQQLSRDYDRPSNILLLDRMNLPRILEYYNLYNVNIKELDIIIDNVHLLENYRLKTQLEIIREGY